MAELPRVCIIGAGSSGIATCKVFLEQGIPFDCYEMSSVIGGMWAFKNPNKVSSAYRSLHINTSRRRMAYSDFPMPDHYPDFPSHELINDYFNDYVDHFGLRDHIRFNTKVETCTRLDNGCWQVALSDGSTLVYDALVVANGHHWDPRWPQPDFPGEFSGEKLHAHHYIDPTDPIDLTGKRVVVVGFGNSAMDIACELGRKGCARQVYLSTRSGGYILPKYLASKPLDEIYRHPSEPAGWFENLVRSLHLTRALEWLVAPLFSLMIRSQVGRPEDYGLPKPKHRFGHTHPTISSEMHIRLGSGDVLPKPNIARYAGDTVLFEDGSQVKADVVIYATGYNIRFPFFDNSIICTDDNDVALYQRMMDPKFNNLFYLALVQPLCAMMPIAEEQSKWIAAYLKGRNQTPPKEKMEAMLRREHDYMKSKFTESARHTIEIDCQQYTWALWRDMKQGARRAKRSGYALPVPAQASTVSLNPEAN